MNDNGIFGPLLFTAFIALAACTDPRDSDTPPPTPSAPGLVTWQAFEGLAGRYTSDGRTVTFETRRRTTQLEDGEHVDVDVRFHDDSGLAFLIGIGGHAPIDPTWAAEPVVDAGRSPRYADNFKLAAAALDAVATELQEDDAPSPEMTALLELHAGLAQADLHSGSTVDLPASATASYRHDVEIRKKRAFWGLTPYDHSAILLKIYNASSQLIIVAWTSNHGTAAIDPSMALHCARSFWRTGTATPLSESPCQTSWGITPGTHLCNDDTKIQYENVKANGFLTTWNGLCSDSTMNLYAPFCT